MSITSPRRVINIEINLGVGDRERIEKDKER